MAEDEVPSAPGGVRTESGMATCSPPAPAQLFRALCDFTARRAGELSVSRGDRLHALREEGGCILARKLSGWPCTGLVPITYVAKVAPEMLSDKP